MRHFQKARDEQNWPAKIGGDEVHGITFNWFVGPSMCDQLYMDNLRPITHPADQNLEIVELSHMVYAKIQNGIFHSNGHNFASRKDFLASPEVLESRSSRLHDAQKIGSIRPLRVKCELVRF